MNPFIFKRWLPAAALVAGLSNSPASAAGTNALDRYVNTPDSAFAWKRVEQSKSIGFTLTQLAVTSQKWREHTWTHHMQIVRPATVRNPHVAFLFITGDGTGKSSVNLLRLLAERAGAVAAVVSQVPNQPLYGGKVEDALIAHTFDRYLKTGDESWPLLFPMTKSAVRAMDAVAAFAKQEDGAAITNFVVAGMSKRGWTTWLTGAVDPRVKGIAPMVIDMLNWRKQIEWTEKVYGRQSEMIHDYTDLNLHLKLDEPRVMNIRAWVDPYSYLTRCNMPKLLLLGTNDPYWTVDSLRHYWEELPGPKFVHQTPNGGHGLGDMKDAAAALAAFFEMIADGSELPKVEWNFTGKEGSELNLAVQPPAQSVRLFTADSRDRDFRDEKWSSRALPTTDTGKATGQVSIPTNGWRAFMGEVSLKTPRGHDYKLSTQVRVVPDNVK